MDGFGQLDMLGSMPSGADEFMPVDLFFQHYIDELNMRSKRALEPGGPDICKAAKLGAGQAAGVLLHGGPLQPQAGLAGAMQPPFVPTGAPLAQPGMMLPGMQGGLLNGSGVPLNMLGDGMPAAFPASGPASFAGPPNGSGQLFGGADLQHMDAGGGGYDIANQSGSLSGGGVGDDSAGDSKRKTVKQQEANKVAQQRYRERKKQKFHEMEATIDQLSRQLQALQALQSRNNMLEGLNGELQTQLVGKEKEVERLKLALDVVAERSLGSPSSLSGDGGEGVDLECADDGCVSCDVLPQDMAGIDFKKGFSDQVARLREFVAQHGLASGAVAEGGLSKELTSQLAQIVGRSCQLCQAALRAEGVKVMELISKDPNSLSTVDNALEQHRWLQCLEVMHLSGEQQEHLLLNRRSHLQRMRAIYQERHNLNMQAMSLMLPHASKNPFEDNTVEGRMMNMSQAGYLPVAKSSAELGDVLDKIKDNLRREQRAVMDLNCITIAKILTPLQAAHYMLRAYPQHCDALALSNMLAKHLGRDEVSDVAAPASGAAAATSPGGCGQQEGSGGCC